MQKVYFRREVEVGGSKCSLYFNSKCYHKAAKVQQRKFMKNTNDQARWAYGIDFSLFLLETAFSEQCSTVSCPWWLDGDSGRWSLGWRLDDSSHRCSAEEVNNSNSNV